jgi:hypothetical protein
LAGFTPGFPRPRKKVRFRPSFTGSSGGYATVTEKLPVPVDEEVELTVTAIGVLTAPGAIGGIVAGLVARVRQGAVVHVMPVMVPIVILGVASVPVPVFSRQKYCTLLPPALIDQGLVLLKLAVW